MLGSRSKKKKGLNADNLIAFLEDKNVADSIKIKHLVKLKNTKQLDYSITFKGGETLLHIAAKSCGKELAEFLLAQSSKLIDTLTSDDSNVLFYAAKHDNEILFEYFLQHKHFLEKKRKQLHALNKNKENIQQFANACKSEFIKGVYKFSDHCGTRDIPNKKGLYQIHQLAKYGKQKILLAIIHAKLFSNTLTILTDNIHQHNIFQVACRYGHLNLAKALAIEYENAKISIHQLTENRLHPIHIVAKGGHKNIITWFLEEKKDGIPKNLRAYCKILHEAVNIACNHGHLDLLKMLNCELQKRGHGISEFSNNGCHPLHNAAKNGHKDVVEWLVTEKRISIYMKTKKAPHDTAFQLAYKNKHFEVAAILIKEWCTQENKKNHSLLYYAMQEGHDELVIYLIDEHLEKCKQQKKDVNYLALQIDDNQDYNIFHLSCIHKRLDLAKKILIQFKTTEEVTKCLNTPTKQGLFPIHLLIESGDITMLQWLIKNYPFTLDAITQDAVAYNVFHFSCKHGQLAIATLLLNKVGSKLLNIASKNGFLPLHIASQNGHEALLFWLLDEYKKQDKYCKPLEIQTNNERGYNIFHLMCAHNHLDLAKKILTLFEKIEDKKNYVNIPTKQGWYAIHLATEYGHKNIVDWHIELFLNSIELTSKNKDAYTIFHIACAKGHKDLAEAIAKRFADNNKLIQLFLKSSQNPIYVAIQADQKAITNWLIKTLPTLLSELVSENENRIDAFYQACATGDLKKAKVLFAIHGAELHCSKDDGTYPIHIATIKGQEAIVYWLLDFCGIPLDLRTANKNQYTIFHLAVMNLDSSNGKQLTKNIAARFNANAKVNAFSKSFHPIHDMAKIGDIIAVNFMLDECNISLELRSESEIGESGFHIGVAYDQVVLVKELVKRKSDIITQQTKNGWEPIHLAAVNGAEKVMALLINEYQVDPFIASAINNGITPFHLACQHGHLATAKILAKAYHANQKTIHQRSNDGYHAFHKAAVNFQDNILSWLIEEENIDPDIRIITANSPNDNQDDEQGDGKTALDLLYDHMIHKKKSMSKAKKCIRLLVAKGADTQGIYNKTRKSDTIYLLLRTEEERKIRNALISLQETNKFIIHSLKEKSCLLSYSDNSELYISCAISYIHAKVDVLESLIGQNNQKKDIAVTPHIKKPLKRTRDFLDKCKSFDQNDIDKIKPYEIKRELYALEKVIVILTELSGQCLLKMRNSTDKMKSICNVEFAELHHENIKNLLILTKKYTLALMSDNAKIEINKLYVKVENDRILYMRVSLDSEKNIYDEISNNDFQKTLNKEVIIPKENDLKKLEPMKLDILAITFSRGHTLIQEEEKSQPQKKPEITVDSTINHSPRFLGGTVQQKKTVGEGDANTESYVSFRRASV